MKNAALANRIKANYEAPETSRRITASDIIYARIDGRRFSRFTKDFTRPFDAVFAALMKETAAALVMEFQPLIAYVQSDEISLLFYNSTPESTHLYDGRCQKLVSTLAATATSHFTLNGLETIHREKIIRDRPTFDARVFGLPDKTEATNAILWRSLDCLKNAKSQYAHHYLSPTEMHGKTGNEMIAEVREKHGADFDGIDDYYKYGCFYRTETILSEISAETYSKIPESKRPASRLVQRNQLQSYLLELRQLKNRVEFIFDKAGPIQ